ncbi:S-layer homology domain-containing protein [Heyndrickxia oleronia]|uniref:S-layer homology domain-containing protein n=1 Tax=Heyndrickxia oleronia TaxID=38875 RepID=UPI003F2850FB
MAKKSRKVFATTATAALVASAVAPIASSAAGFSDVTKPEYKTAIDALAEAGILNGYENGTFKPENKVTRGEVAKVITLIRHLGEGTKTPFKDVKDGYWSTQYINSLYAAKLINGYEDGTFKPEGNVTRAEFAKLVVDAYGLTLTNAATPFTDVKAGNWATPYIQTAYANGLIKGVTASKFDPSAPIKRGDLAILLHRADSKFGDVIGNNFPGVELVKATNNTTVEVTFKNEVDAKDVQAAKFSIEGLTVSNAAVKQTDSKTVVLTTSAQEGGKQYTVKSGSATLGKFIGASAVVPSAIKVTTTSLQGVIGKEVTLKAQVTVEEGKSKAGIPVTFNIVNTKSDLNSKIEVEALTDENGVASYSYTRYYDSEDNVTAYATSKSSVNSAGKVYWAKATQLGISEITTGNELANNTKKSYKVTGKANTTYYVAIKENIGVTPDKITNVMVQSHKDNDFVTPYELSTGKDVYATVTTNASGEGSFTVYGSNLSATPVVYLPSSVNTSATDYSYSALALQAEAPTVKFSQMDKLAIKVTAEGVADSAEYLNTPTTYDGNSIGGRTYTVTVTDKDGKLAPEGTTAYVKFEAGNINGDVYFSTGTANFEKVTEGSIKAITVGKEGKASFRVAGKGATTFVKPTVFLNTAGKTSPVELDKTDVQTVAEVTYFKSPVVTNATLKVTDVYGRTVTSLEAGKDAYFTYQSVDQNGFDYRPNGYNSTGQTTQVVWKPVTQPDGSIVYVQEIVTIPGSTVYEYTLAFDVTSTFGNAKVMDAAGNVLNPSQNAGSTKTYQVKSDATGKAIVRVTSESADTVSVNVTGASNILPTQTASVSFTNSASVPSLYTGVVESFDTVKQTLKFEGKNPISYVGDKVVYRNVNNQPIANADDFAAELGNAAGPVKVTYEVKDGVTTFYIISIGANGGGPVDTGTVGAKALAAAIKAAEDASIKEEDYTAASWKVFVDALKEAKGVSDTAPDATKSAAAKKLSDAQTALKTKDAASAPTASAVSTDDKEITITFSSNVTVAAGQKITIDGQEGTVAEVTNDKKVKVSFTTAPTTVGQGTISVTANATETNKAGDFTYQVKFDPAATPKWAVTVTP